MNFLLIKVFSNLKTLGENRFTNDNIKFILHVMNLFYGSIGPTDPKTKYYLCATIRKLLDGGKLSGDLIFSLFVTNAKSFG